MAERLEPIDPQVGGLKPRPGAGHSERRSESRQVGKGVWIQKNNNNNSWRFAVPPSHPSLLFKLSHNGMQNISRRWDVPRSTSPPFHHVFISSCELPLTCQQEVICNIMFLCYVTNSKKVQHGRWIDEKTTVDKQGCYYIQRELKTVHICPWWKPGCCTLLSRRFRTVTAEINEMKHQQKV